VAECPIPIPGPHEVLIKVDVCGMCHSDAITRFGVFNGFTFPRIPGHEIAGKIVKLGREVHSRWKLGQSVGAGWHGSHCNSCTTCRKGVFVSCDAGQATGVTRDGGHAEYVAVFEHALVPIPDGMAPEIAAPLMCAGVTVYNGLRNVPNVHAGDIVAVQGIGGLGHLGIQFARKMGYEVVAITTSDDKRELAMQLGAHHVINSKTHDIGAELMKLGGAKVVLATASDSASMQPLVKGLGLDGTLLMLGYDVKPLQISIGDLLMKRAGVRSWPGGSAIDTEETLKMAHLFGVKPMIEVFPLEKINEAFDHMMANKARFRVVIKP